MARVERGGEERGEEMVWKSIRRKRGEERRGREGEVRARSSKRGREEGGLRLCEPQCGYLKQAAAVSVRDKSTTNSEE
ncbi:hypothetical protein BP00DRAFT_237455 [Aspergillus indologenus CBS 114.80]|uniref:Uncharacterized protein n=1 Tax=Aspergillus indologenus CBS 114.80 TaxID=1450541 RepID=A0A2V5IFX6_9EURO|nr:hypothetical protein BP00DRAFT_237455 [Aspergillus indologenus CBS 114.80]